MTDIYGEDVIVCRPAQAKDTEAVMELSSHIWEGGDYLPYVWEEWLADPEGLLGVAEIHGRVAGVFKLTRFQDDEWWMEGLRVHPDFQGQGVASHIHNYVVDTWRKIGKGVIRLVTASFNIKVHHMCEQGGFRRMVEVIPYRAESLPEKTESFNLLTKEDAGQALELAESSEMFNLASRMVNLGWVYGDLQLKHIQATIDKGRAWWWRCRSGILTTSEEEEDGELSPWVQLLACPLSSLEEMLTDYRRLMSASGYKHAYWMAPNHPEVISTAEKAGFAQSWDISFYIYELREESSNK